MRVRADPAESADRVRASPGLAPASCQVREIAAPRRGKPAAHRGWAMTRFDRFWEPLLVITAAAMIWIGTL
ncbi:MAG: hypothetical protein M3680_09375 [Myxococcota bacterium]|nr:hypothetical protein [Myxococcota bacterium]